MPIDVYISDKQDLSSKDITPVCVWDNLSFWYAYPFLIRKNLEIDLYGDKCLAGESLRDFAEVLDLLMEEIEHESAEIDVKIGEYNESPIYKRISKGVLQSCLFSLFEAVKSALYSGNSILLFGD